MAEALRAAAVGGAEKLGRYLLTDCLGEGSFGRVHKAWDPEFRRHVAIKVPDGGRAPRRFVREVRVMGQLDHPHVVNVLDSRLEGGQPYLVMELMAGDLRKRLEREGTLEPREAAATCAKLASALAHAHALGILHRDVKPANVLVDAQGEPRLADFGLAKADDGLGRTATGVSGGTPGYMAPEQILSLTIDGRSDVHALGATLYECLSGAKPFRGRNQKEIVRQTLHAEAPRLARIDPQLEAICLKCLEKQPGWRYRSAAELGQDLERYLAGELVRARQHSLSYRCARWLYRRRFGAGLVLAVLGVVVGVGLAVDLVHSRKEARRDRELAEQASTRADEESQARQLEAQRRRQENLELARSLEAQAREAGNASNWLNMARLALDSLAIESTPARRGLVVIALDRAGSVQDLEVPGRVLGRGFESIQWVPGEGRLVGSSAYGDGAVWDTRRQLRAFQLNRDTSPSSVPDRQPGEPDDELLRLDSLASGQRNAWSASGLVLATTYADGRLRLWVPGQGAVKWFLQFDDRLVTDLAWAPAQGEGSLRLATAVSSADETGQHHMELLTLTQISSAEPWALESTRLVSSNARISTPRWSSTGAKLAFATGAELVVVTPNNQGSAEVVARVRCRSEIQALSWAPDGASILVVNKAGAQVVDVAMRQIVFELPAESPQGAGTSELIAVDLELGTIHIPFQSAHGAWAQSGRLFASAFDRTLVVTSAWSWEENSRCSLPEIVTDIAWHPSEDLLAVAHGAYVDVFEARSLYRLARLDLGARCLARALAWSPDGNSLAVACGWGQHVALWEPVHGSVRLPLTLFQKARRGYTLGTRRPSWTTDERLVLVPESGAGLALLAVSSPRVVQRLPRASSGEISPEGERVVLSRRKRDLSPGPLSVQRLGGALTELSGPTSSRSAAWSPDGESLLFYPGGSVFTLFNGSSYVPAVNGALPQEIEAQEATWSSQDPHQILLYDAHNLLIYGRDGRLEAAKAGFVEQRIGDAALGPGNRVVVVAREISKAEGRLWTWNPRSAATKEYWTDVTYTQVAWPSSGTHWVLQGEAGMDLRASATGALLTRTQLPEAGSFAVSPSGRLIALGDVDGTPGLILPLEMLLSTDAELRERLKRKASWASMSTWRNAVSRLCPDPGKPD